MSADIPQNVAEDPGFGELRAGTLGVRIATSAAEVDAGQALRYRVFYQEMGAQPDAAAQATQRDSDIYDAVADHLLVLDHARGEGAEAVAATYRLIRAPAAARVGRFYSADEYDITRVLAFPGQCWNLAAPACIATTATGRRCSCCGAASPPM